MPEAAQTLEALVIGAGISGLVAAYRLMKSGRDVLLIESSDRVGGVIHSQEAEEFLIERGPNSFRGTSTLLDLFEELGLMNDLVTADPRAPAFIYGGVYAGHGLEPVPMSLAAALSTRLISARGKLRLLREPFIARRRDSREESIAAFVRRRLGSEVLDNLIAPFVSGVYAGDPERLSIQATFARLARLETESGSIVKGLWKTPRPQNKKKKKKGIPPKRSLRQYRLCSFASGLEQWPKALASKLGLRLRTNSRAVSITRSHSGRLFEVILDEGERQLTVHAKNLIVATPAGAAAGLLSKIAPEIATRLETIEYVSLVSLPLAYRAEVRLHGFGFLAARSAGLRILGSVWNSSLFRDRAPAGWVLLTSFIGGATDSEAIHLSDDELISIADRDLKQVLAITSQPRRLPITRWARAIPQYTIGHAAKTEELQEALKRQEGLWLIGNYLGGVSLGDCIENATKIAGAVAGDAR
jgi:protoporphyrinogen/coproporphyrinogen III oxidase